MTKNYYIFPGIVAVALVTMSLFATTTDASTCGRYDSSCMYTWTTPSSLAYQQSYYQQPYSYNTYPTQQYQYTTTYPTTYTTTTQYADRFVPNNYSNTYNNAYYTQPTYYQQQPAYYPGYSAYPIYTAPVNHGSVTNYTYYTNTYSW